jgi:hypothetical protein
VWWRWALLVVVLAGLGGGGCATESSGDRLRKRAAFDLHCTKDELEITRLDKTTRGVRGCGRQATYLYVCDRPGNAFAECSWVMNSHGHVAQDED